MNSLFTREVMSLQLKWRLIRCVVLSVLFCRVEAWTTIESTIKRLEAFEMWAYSCILRISWTNNITSVEVKHRIKIKKEVVFTVKNRKLEYFVHIMRHDKYCLLQLIVQGKVNSKRRPERRQHFWMHNMCQRFGLSAVQLFRDGVNKINGQCPQRIRQCKRKK